MSVLGPYQARHPSPLRRPSTKHNPPSYHSAPSDPFYGHADTAQLCQRFIRSLFACPDVPPPAATASGTAAPTPTLVHFVAYALHRTRLNPAVTFTALALLARLKGRFPQARGSSGHRLFISAFMIASKVVCDDTYSNKSWTVVGQAMFSLREINQMEREMCGYLEWQLNVPPQELARFEAVVRRDYGPSGTCPDAVRLPSLTAKPDLATPPASPKASGAPPLVPTPALHAKHGTPPPLSHSPASDTTGSPITPREDDEDEDGATIVSAVVSAAAVPAPSRTDSALSMVSSASLAPVKSQKHREPGFAYSSRSVW